MVTLSGKYRIEIVKMIYIYDHLCFYKLQRLTTLFKFFFHEHYCSGAHTIGLVRCNFFRARIYNETNIDPSFATSMQAVCPFDSGDDNFSPLDSKTPTTFDNAYYQNLVNLKGLVHSDQQLFVNGSGLTDSQVITYSRNMGRFKKDFAEAMLKMSLLSPLTGSDGQIRTNCNRINPPPTD